MTIFFADTSQTSDLPLFEFIAGNQTLVINPGVTWATEGGSSPTVVSTGGPLNSRLLVEGRLLGDAGTVLLSGEVLTVDVSASGSIRSIGVVTPLDDAQSMERTAVTLVAPEGTIALTNAGSISSNTGAAVRLGEAVGNAQAFGWATLHNSGDISGSFAGLRLDNGEVASVVNSGTIRGGLTQPGNGILVGTASTTIVNSGEIHGDFGTGIFIQPNTVSEFGPTADVVIDNTGTISGRFGIYVFENGEGATVRITNGGTINGGILGAQSQEIIVNTGMIRGDVLLGANQDSIDTRFGIVTGVVDGGEDDDTYFISSAATQIRDTGTSLNDIVYSTVSLSLNQLASATVENLVLLDGALNGTGTAGANLLYGNGADNILRGRGGRDLLDGGEGADTLIGGIGNDVFEIDDLDTVIEFAGQGLDTVNVGPTFDGNSYALAANVENLLYVAQFGITAIGNALNNDIVTGSFNDTLNGTTGTDTLTGSTGDDLYITDGGDTLIDDDGTDTVQSSVSFALAAGFENLTLTGTAVLGTGNSAANTITGNAGANSLNGLAGNDTLTGGAEADSFIFTTAPGTGNIDRITDYNAAADTIRIDNAVFTGLAAGALAATAYAQNTSGNAADASDRIIYETDTGALWFDRDGTGAAAKVQFATLNTGLALTAADFFVI